MKTDKYVVVDTNEWVTQKHNLWPMLEDIDIKQQLQSGLWVVVLYHCDCPGCAKTIPLYEEMYKSLKGNENVINFAFIEMPPYGNEKQQLVSPDSEVTRGKLNEAKKWFVQTPVVVVLNDGIALKASEGKALSLDEILEVSFGK